MTVHRTNDRPTKLAVPAKSHIPLTNYLSALFSLINWQKRNPFKENTPYTIMPMKKALEKLCEIEPEAKLEDEEVIRFRKHPIYNLYAGSKCGKFIHVGRKVINSGRYNRTGYLMCTVTTKTRDRKDYLVHRFIWECNVAIGAHASVALMGKNKNISNRAEMIAKPSRTRSIVKPKTVVPVKFNPSH